MKSGPVPQEIIDQRRTARMEAVDNLPEPVRALVHEYGLTTVKAIMDCGVSKPNQVRHIIETVLDEFSPTRGSFAAQGPRTALTDPRKASSQLDSNGN